MQSMSAVRIVGSQPRALFFRQRSLAESRKRKMHSGAMETVYLSIGTFHKAFEVWSFRAAAFPCSFVYQAWTWLHHSIRISSCHHLPERVEPQNWVSRWIEHIVVSWNSVVILPWKRGRQPAQFGSISDFRILRSTYRIPTMNFVFWKFAAKARIIQSLMCRGHLDPRKSVLLSTILWVRLLANSFGHC